VNRTTTRTNARTWSWRVALAAAAALAMLSWPRAAHAQLDPLLFAKRVPPTVVVVMDSSFQMLNDGYAGAGDVWPNGSIYDTHTYHVADLSDEMRAALKIPAGAFHYRRIYRNLQFSTSVPTASDKFTADDIEAISNLDSRYARFWNSTRYDMARLGLRDAVEHNRGALFRWGLLKLRQNSPVRRSSCEKPVTVPAGSPLDGLTDGACEGGALGIFATSVSSLNSMAAAASATIVAPAANTAQSLLNVLGTDTTNGADANPSLIPAGLDTKDFEDRPLTLALDDAKTAVTNAIAADAACGTCRNTVIVLITGGRDYAANPGGVAAQLKALGAGGGHKVPVFVVWVRPGVHSPQYAADRLQLQTIADSSGGVLVQAWSRPDVARAVNLALQTGFSRPNDLNVASERKSSEFYPVSPVIGTVNLDGASDSAGSLLQNTIVYTGAGDHIPQRNNFMVTSGFGVGLADAHAIPWGPGFYGRMRAFRVFKAIPDSTKPSGYTFTKDGTALWPDRDGRPEAAGLARVPRNPDDRNIYTYIPGQGMVAFTAANQAQLAPYLGSFTSASPSLNTSSVGAATLINFLRALPLGAIVSSTPAIMDPPSLDPPPDDDYGRADAIGTYAGDHHNRRSIIWFGANDGMLHAVDARTGYEVWAFIPYNLLPKLRAMYEQGQPFEQFNYYVDQSPKIAEVKSNGEWRSYLVIGEGTGGTFYQAFDVTEAGMGGPDPDSDDYAGALSSFASAGRVDFKWSFPDYENFDSTIRQDIWLTSTGTPAGTASDTTPGSVYRVYGELSAGATAAERTVGQTWSDPAVGALNLDRSVNAAIVGSGYYPARAEATLAGRSGATAGHAFYLIRMETGELVGNAGGAACTGMGCYDVGEGAPSPKNALQADPTVTGNYGAYVAKWAYMGDLDGKYYRFQFDSTGRINAPLVLKTTTQPIYASSALMYVGSLNRYIFFMTGSDLLPTAPATSGGIGTFKLFGVQDSNGVFSDSFSPIPMDHPAVTNSGGLPVGERPSTSPAVAGEIVFFTTTVDVAASCSTTTTGIPADTRHNLYAVTYRGTGAYTGVSSGSSGGGGTTTALFQSGAGRATAPFIVDQHLYYATSGATGPKVEAYGDPNDFNNGVGQVGVRILSWREIRR
jgi:hypothetical protein